MVDPVGARLRPHPKDAETYMAKKGKFPYFTVILILVVALFLALTNPNQTQFKNWYQTQSELQAKGDSSGAVSDVVGAFAKVVGGLASSEYRRTDCGLFSLFQSRNSKGEVIHSYLGLARTFVKLK